MKILLNKKIYNVPLFQLFIFLIILIFNSCFSVIQASVLEKGVNIAIGSNRDDLISCISLYIGLTIVYSIFIYLQGIFSSKLGRRVVCDLQNKTYEKVVKIPVEKSEKYSEGDYLTLITDDSENTSAYLFQGIIPIISEIIRIMIGFFYLLRTSMLIASIFAILTIILLLITRYYSNKVRKISSSLQIIEGENRNFLFETKQNQEIIRVFNAFKTRNTIFKKLFNHKCEKKMENALYTSKLNCFSNLIINLSTIFIVFIGFYLSTINLISIGSLVGIYTVIGESILYPLLRLPDKLIENSKRKASLIRINNFLNLEHEISIISKSFLDNVEKKENYLFEIIG
ncbi:MAG: ABC transporter transmembrane domain-containing protein, partial [Clostridia bacterium]